MKACAFTIRNRVKAGWYGGDWISVLAHHREWSARIEPYSEELPDPRNYAFNLFLQDITGIFTGLVEDNITVTDSSASIRQNLPLSAGPSPVLYYGRLDQITNPWFLEQISQNHDKHRVVAQVGLLHFFS
jgi:hypothetical protein